MKKKTIFLFVVLLALTTVSATWNFKDHVNNSYDMEKQNGNVTLKTASPGNTYVYFDGDDDLESTVVFPTADNTQTFSMTLWTFDNGSSSHSPYVNYKFNFGADNGWQYKCLVDGSPTQELLAGKVAQATTGDCGGGDWIHHAISYTTGTNKLLIWLNGVIDVNTTFSNMENEDTTNTQVNYGSEDGGQWFIGGLDDVRFFNNTVLNTAQVNEIMSNTTTTLPDNITFWHPFEESQQSYVAAGGGDTCTYGGSGDWSVTIGDNCTVVTTTLGATDTLIISGDDGRFIIPTGVTVTVGALSVEPDDFDGDFRVAVESGGSLEIV